jgi:hypothetical protein
MRDFKNNVIRHLESDEMLAVMECSKLLEKAFKKKVFSVVVNPVTNNPTDVFGVAFAFDMVIEGYKSGSGQNG